MFFNMSQVKINYVGNEFKAYNKQKIISRLYKKERKCFFFDNLSLINCFRQQFWETGKSLFSNKETCGNKTTLAESRKIVDNNTE